MNGEIYDDLALEKMAKERFGVKFEIEKVYVRSIPAGRSANASVLLTTKNKLYVIVMGSAPLTLGDVRTIIRRMGLVADAFASPKSKPDYFTEIAEKKFRHTYPGRQNVTEADLRYYQSMAPYNPALVSISGIKDGTIRQFDSMADGGWRPTAKIQYKQIKL